MTPFVVLFLSLAALAVGAYAGWVLRSRMEVAASEDPESELRALRETHSGCANRIRGLHLELAQLETKLSMSRVETVARPPSAPVSDDELAGAARLASLIDALEARTETEPATGQPERPAAFMSILPADLVENRAVREAPQEPSAPSAEPAVVIALVPQDDPVIELAATGPDDLTLIKGIGPKIEAILHEQGITTFRQIADLDATQIEVLGMALGSFRGRIVRDDWVGAARRMVGTPAVR